jgi:hypothetical protein
MPCALNNKTRPTVTLIHPANGIDLKDSMLLNLFALELDNTNGKMLGAKAKTMLNAAKKPLSADGNRLLQLTSLVLQSLPR